MAWIRWIALGLIVSAGCGRSTTAPAKGLRVVSAEVSSPRVSESVTFSFTTVNESGDGLDFPAGRFFAYDAVVMDASGDVVWRRLQGAFGAPATPFTIGEGESETWVTQWSLEDSDGGRVAPGDYVIRGLVGPDLNDPLVQTELIPFEVVEG